MLSGYRIKGNVCIKSANTEEKGTALVCEIPSNHDGKGNAYVRKSCYSNESEVELQSA